MSELVPFTSFFFFNDTATTEIYTLSLHDALPIFLDGVAPESDIDRVRGLHRGQRALDVALLRALLGDFARRIGDRKSTRLNSSHSQISYAVFCLKKTRRNISCLFRHCGPARYRSD